SESDIALATAVANQTGIAIRQAELYQRAEATSAREAMINRLSHAIRASLSLPEVLHAATQELGLALQASRVAIFPYDPTGAPAAIEHEYVAPHATSIKHVEITYDDPVGEYLCQTLEPRVVDNAAEYVGATEDLTAYVRERARQLGFLSRVTCPLVVDGRFRGALSVQQTDRVRRWSEDELALIKAVAAQLATGIKQAELFEMVVDAKEEWETTFNAMSDGVFIFNESGRLVRANRAGAALEDARPDDLIGRQCCDILHTTERECIVTRCLREQRRLMDEVAPGRVPRSLFFTAEPILAGDGRVAGAVCSVRDLSELRKIEAVAREHQSLLRSVLDSAREAIYALDTEGYVQWCNQGVSTMGGYAPEDLIGHHFLAWASPAEREGLKERFLRSLGGEAQSYEMTYLGADKQTRFALVNNTPLIIDGRTTGVLGILRDITEQKIERERAAQAEKLRALGQLASGVAHDFNNALAAIIGRAQLLGRLIQDNTLATHLDVIQTAAADAAETVRRIQTFARQPRVKKFELLNVASLLRDAMELTRTRGETEARARELRYDVQLDADGDLYLEGSASELREVFVNLIVNALDAMPGGGSLLIVGRRAGERAQILFTDTGAGMSEEVRERVFEPFYTTKGAQGTGLGLFVSYGIIERHRGLVNIESELGRGTTFALDLPAIEMSNWPGPGGSRRASSSAAESMLSVLVVDDETYVRETLGEIVSVLGHRVVKADGGKAALAALALEPFDLVFVDFSMPLMDGWQVAREVRRMQPVARVVLTTGYGQEVLAPDDEETLVDSIIAKPFDFAQVADVIAHIAPRPTANHIDSDIKQKAG
ncbi:MAG TPA: PAS domain-containing protein, partial [Pyrinomonadaceae bacterium]|nr:PAS domain-containing protein [Pyrinomonadaceae bacterium]